MFLLPASIAETSAATVKSFDASRVARGGRSEHPGKAPAGGDSITNGTHNGDSSPELLWIKDSDATAERPIAADELQQLRAENNQLKVELGKAKLRCNQAMLQAMHYQNVNSSLNCMLHAKMGSYDMVPENFIMHLRKTG